MSRIRRIVTPHHVFCSETSPTPLTQAQPQSDGMKSMGECLACVSSIDLSLASGSRSNGSGMPAVSAFYETFTTQKSLKLELRHMYIW